MKKYLIFGNGWIGNLLKSYFGEEADLYIGKIEHFYAYQLVQWNNYQWIINTAAQTDIDWCEKNRALAFQDNVVAAKRLNSIAVESKKRYLFFSSACVFESLNPEDVKIESSIPNPQCFYSQTKVWAEEEILKENPAALIIRPRLPVSEIPHPRNTLTKLLNYPFINDAKESVTVLEDLFPLLRKLMEEKKAGIFHTVNEGLISPAEMAFLLGHEFETVSKATQDERLKKEGRAKRVTCSIGSERIDLLPEIDKRIVEVVKKYQSYGGINNPSQ